ncbi:Hypothetical protein, putative [Bodo saltans]|uniref:Uncharacterized protein n=1 Tax=Bodo saltans TaxID=75058 RepID=A0A0S4J9V6_BODSA|nr:Hypothetical protein, putative [Bodo saltans]|eukprot:CUG85413.1 Hypothetical protein, putative [Bodo saltans]
MDKLHLERLLDEGESLLHGRETKPAPQRRSDIIANAELALAKTQFQIFLRPRKAVSQLTKPPSPISSPNESDASLHTTSRH